jgi:hypothetical protein
LIRAHPIVAASIAVAAPPSAYVSEKRRPRASRDETVIERAERIAATIAASIA